jgi:ABC-type transport system substrate-binding protein
MRFIALRLFAAISGACFAAQFFAFVPSKASTQPRYGGTLRVELHTANVSLDPRAWSIGSLEAATDEKLAALIFERLVELDNYGRFQPVLATEWSHDSSGKRWQFVLRSGVKFSDGAPLTSNDVVTALQSLLPEQLQVSAAGNTINIQSTTALTDLLEQLASGRYLVYRTASDGTLLGTGPFVLTGKPASNTSSASAAHLLFRANEEAWSGRPYLDAIDVALGVPALRAMFDLQLGKADLIELAPDLAPRAKQANLRVWSSDPVVLYGLRFDDAQAAATDARLREALSLALDRGTMANVLLQKQAQPAAALLPQWLSGYAFVFNVEANLERAKELRRSLPASASAADEPLRLRVEPAGDLPKLLGERVAVNARQAGILIQVLSRPAQHSSLAVPASTTSAAAQPDTGSGVHLFVWRYSSLSARAELDSILVANHLAASAEASAASPDREQLFARERRVLEAWQVLPLVEQAESVALGATVRNWLPARWGEWHLADVWLEPPEATQANGVNPSNAIQPSLQKPTVTGAKP